MKLARPDIFHPRIVLAGCPRYAAGDPDDAGLVAALRQRGLHARWLSWDDPETRQADLVILRATRDYARRLDEFLAWTTSVPNLLNPPAVVAWNSDARYLADLARRGVPTAGRHEAGHRVVLVFVGGAQSHAFTLQASTLVQAEVDFEAWDVAAAALAAAAAQVGVEPSGLLYARAHLVGARLQELKLVDPSLGLLRLNAGSRAEAERRFAVAVESACERLGLGPLAH